MTTNPRKTVCLSETFMMSLPAYSLIQMNPRWCQQIHHKWHNPVHTLMNEWMNEWYLNLDKFGCKALPGSTFMFHSFEEPCSADPIWLIWHIFLYFLLLVYLSGTIHVKCNQRSEYRTSSHGVFANFLCVCHGQCICFLSFICFNDRGSTKESFF